MRTVKRLLAVFVLQNLSRVKFDSHGRNVRQNVTTFPFDLYSSFLYRYLESMEWTKDEIDKYVAKVQRLCANAHEVVVSFARIFLRFYVQLCSEFLTVSSA